MKNTEEQIKTDKLDLYIAIKRKKENPDLKKELCFRTIIIDEEKDLNYLKAKISSHPGIWRIYRTVNSRNTDIARKLLMCKLINEPDKWSSRIDTLWRSMLLQKECKATNNFLIDIDSKDENILKEVFNILNLGKSYPFKNTPNGFHIIVPKFDTRLLEKFDCIEIKRDAYYFIEKIIIS